VLAPAVRHRADGKAAAAPTISAIAPIAFRPVPMDAEPAASLVAAGYRPIANFNRNPVASFLGEKRL
jgi:hypothetical protein